MTIKQGDVFRHVLAGAGGWGDPLERDPAAVLRDVRNELLSPGKAAADYGVVDRYRRLDASMRPRPARRRAEIRRARGWTRAFRRSNGTIRCRSRAPRNSAMTVTYRVGVDIGGTFTDIVLLGSDGTVHTKKISSSVEQLRPGHRRRA